MIGLVICCHGDMGDGMRNAAEIIVGPQEHHNAFFSTAHVILRTNHYSKASCAMGNGIFSLSLLPFLIYFAMLE